MAFTEPHRLGPFFVDAEGRLSPAEQGTTPGFSVQWHGRVIHARLVWGDTPQGSLSIKCDLGRIPSTANDPAARAESLAFVRGLITRLPDEWQPRLMSDHQLHVALLTQVLLPIMVTELVTELAAFMLDLTPYLDMIDDAGLMAA